MKNCEVQWRNWKSPGFIPFETDPGKPDVDRFCLIVTDITQSKRAENVLKKYARDLTERNKELKCLYSISRLISDSGLSMDDIMTQAIQYPEDICGRITLSGKKFTIPRFQKTDRHLFQKILLKNEVIGQIDIYGSKEMPMTENTLFLEEEKDLIDSVALRLGHALKRLQAEHKGPAILLMLLCRGQINSKTGRPLEFQTIISRSRKSWNPG